MSDPDDRLGQVLGGVADPVQIGARGGTLGALDQGARAVLYVERALDVLTAPEHYRRDVALACVTQRARAPNTTRRDEIAPCLGDVDLASGQVHVGLLDQSALVGRERHPLGEHVV